MKKQFFCVLSAAVIAASSVPAFADTFEDGSFYKKGADNSFMEGWNADGAGAFQSQENEDGSISARWDSILNCLTMQGKSYDEPIDMPEQYDIAYELEAEAVGVSYFGVFGWLNNPQTQFYIIDGWTGCDLLNDGTPVKTVEIGGVQYDLFLGSYLKNNPNDFEPRTVWTYWNIRHENAWKAGEKAEYKGTVPLAEQLRAWEDLDDRAAYYPGTDYQLSQAYAAVIAWGTGPERAAGICTIKEPEISMQYASDEALTGDANCDGVVDVSDAVLVMRYAVEDRDAVVTEQGLKNADADKNGKTNESDATMILKYIAKKITL